MELHTFTHWDSEHWSGGRYASADAVVTLDMSFAEWWAIHGGGYLDFVPIEYSPCRTGFRPYRAVDRAIFGVRLSPEEMLNSPPLQTFKRGY